MAEIKEILSPIVPYNYLCGPPTFLRGKNVVLLLNESISRGLISSELNLSPRFEEPGKPGPDKTHKFGLYLNI
jgi:hypothetical protein